MRRQRELSIETEAEPIFTAPKTFQVRSTTRQPFRAFLSARGVASASWFSDGPAVLSARGRGLLRTCLTDSKKMKSSNPIAERAGPIQLGFSLDLNPEIPAVQPPKPKGQRPKGTKRTITHRSYGILPFVCRQSNGSEDAAVVYLLVKDWRGK